MNLAHAVFFNFFHGASLGSAGVDTHDGGRRDEAYDEEFSRRDEEIREARLRLRDQLREVVLGVTGKPVPLDASPKELAAIARKSEAFDYRAALQEISRLDAEAKALARARDEVVRAELERAGREQLRQQQRRLRRQEEEALLLLLLK